MRDPERDLATQPRYHRLLRGLRNDSLSVLREFGPVLAGAKLAIIILSYIGFGSVAKWVIERWYPFTRWIWDQIVRFFDLPALSIIEKDALTVLVFFAPLGLSSYLQFRKRGSTEAIRLRTRLISAVFAIACILIVCYDIISFVLSGGR